MPTDMARWPGQVKVFEVKMLIQHERESVSETYGQKVSYRWSFAGSLDDL